MPVVSFAYRVTSGGVGSGSIGNNAVLSGNIASGQVGQFKLSSGAVNSGHIGNNAVVSESIASGQISIYHIASGVIQSGTTLQSGIVTSGYDIPIICTFKYFSICLTKLLVLDGDDTLLSTVYPFFIFCDINSNCSILSAFSLSN